MSAVSGPRGQWAAYGCSRGDEAGRVELPTSCSRVGDRSDLRERTAGGLHLRSRYGVNLLAVSREGRPVRSRLKSFRFRAGDVLLLQGNKNEMPEIVGELGCLPLAERHLQLGRRKWIWVSIAIFAVAVLGATFGLITPAIALAVAVAALVLLNIVSPEEAYRSVDWSVIEVPMQDRRWGPRMRIETCPAE